MQKKICIKDYLKHSKYNWPVSMLSYPIAFDKAVAENSWGLRNAQGDSIPFQVSDIKREGHLVKSLTLNFLSGLQKGECKEYVFAVQQDVVSTDCGNKLLSAFHVEIDKENCRFAVKYKDKKMVCNIPFDSLEYRTVHSGCIFDEVEISCKGIRGQEYILNVHRIADMPFWELKERMNGFKEDEKGKGRSG